MAASQFHISPPLSLLLCQCFFSPPGLRLSSIPHTRRLFPTVVVDSSPEKADFSPEKTIFSLEYLVSRLMLRLGQSEAFCRRSALKRALASLKNAFLNIAYPTSTLAEAFIQNPHKAWLNNGTIQLKAETSHCDKLLICARALLVSKHDRSILARAGIIRGILGSLYEIPLKWPLIPAFLSFWNSESHTLVTIQGEMGFPLLALQDSMGIPISGRVYDEYVPDSCFHDEVAAALFSAYTTIRKIKSGSDTGGDGLVTLTEWIDHFLMDLSKVENSPQIPLPPNFYAEIDDPLLERLNFRISDGSGNARPLGVYFSNQVMRFNGSCSRAHLLAAFVAAWLCSYCVPVGPESFYGSSNYCQWSEKIHWRGQHGVFVREFGCYPGAIRRSVKSASKCRLSLPIHFIMGWFAYYWRAMPAEPTSIVSVTNFPPLIADIWRASEIDIDLESAHRLFLEVNVQQHCLAHLDFLGRLKVRFPRDTPNQIVDRRHAPDNTRQIRISEIDLLVSSTIGGVSHRQCHIHNNQAYCPQRFARMFHCDQVVPDTWMEGLLRFSEHLSGNFNEITELLRRHLLAYWLPDGHTFEAQVRGRPPICSAGYMLWCKSHLGFLKGAGSFCAGTNPSPPTQKGKSQVPQTDAYNIASGIVRNGKSSLKEKAQAGDCSSSAQPSNMEKHEEASTNGEKSISEATTSGCSKDVPLVDLTRATEVVANERQTSTKHTLPGSNIAKKARKALAGRRKRKSGNNPEVPEGSHAEKACKVDSNTNDSWSTAASKELMEKLYSDIKARVDGLDKSSIDEFNANLPSFDLSPDKYDGISGVTLRASNITDESQWISFYMSSRTCKLSKVLLVSQSSTNPCSMKRLIRRWLVGQNCSLSNLVRVWRRWRKHSRN